MSIRQYNDTGTFSTTLSAQPTANRNITIPDISGTLALVDSQAFTGTPTAPTATAGTNNTQLATTAMVHSAITNDLHVSGTAPMYACRAWVNYNGSSQAIRASGNVSSVTKNGTGDYTINFATAMVDANYSATVTVGNTGLGASGNSAVGWGAVYSTTSIRIGASDNNSDSNIDTANTNISIFR
jgi:hypothetical protein